MRRVQSGISSLAALVACTVWLAGCATPGAQKLTDQQMLAMHKDVIAAISPLSEAANKDWLSGSVRLLVTIDRNNSLSGCTATSTSGAPGLVAVAERACWATVFPPLPAAVFQSDTKRQLSMPIFFNMGVPDNPQRRASYEGLVFPAFSQSQYFWDNGISAVATASVGLAGFRYVADREGRVLMCNTVLNPIERRESEFQQNPQLVQRLNTACMHMNLKDMPGLAVDGKGLATGTVWTAYSPWRQAAPRASDY